MPVTETELDVYSQTDVATVGWDHELEAVVLQWHDFAASDHFREKMNMCIELLEKVGGNKIYADARDQGPINDEDKQWSVVDWASRADAAGLDYLVIVYPESVIAKMAVDTVIEQVDDDIERNITDDVDGGRSWLADKPSSATDVTVPRRESTATPSVTESSEPDTVASTAAESPSETSTRVAESEASAGVDADSTAGADESERTVRETVGTASPERSATPVEPTTSVDVWTTAAVGGLVGLTVSVGLTLSGVQPISVLDSAAMNDVLVLLVLVALGAGAGGLVATLLGDD